MKVHRPLPPTAGHGTALEEGEPPSSALASAASTCSATACRCSRSAGRAIFLRAYHRTCAAQTSRQVLAIIHPVSHQEYRSFLFSLPSHSSMTSELRTPRVTVVTLCSISEGMTSASPRARLS